MLVPNQKAKPVTRSKKYYPLVLSLYNSLVRSGHSRGQVVGRMGILIPATSPNELQAFVCLACLLDQRSRIPGDHTSQYRSYFKLLFTIVCPETNEVRERE